MPSPDTLLAFSLASLLLILLPGPSVLFVVGRSLALGRRAGILSVLGNELGGVPLVVAVALGVGTIVAESVMVFTIIKVVGACYLAYLGWQALRHGADRMEVDAAAAVAPSAWRIVGQGFMVGVTNPKTIVFFVAALPQFVNFHAGNIAAQMLVLGLIFLTVAFVCDAMWAIASGAARDWFAQSPDRLATMRRTGGGMMIGLGGVLLFTGNRH